MIYWYSAHNNKYFFLFYFQDSFCSIKIEPTQKYKGGGGGGGA